MVLDEDKALFFLVFAAEAAEEAEEAEEAEAEGDMRFFKVRGEDVWVGTPLSCKKERDMDLGFDFCKSEAIVIVIFYISSYLNQIKLNQIKK